MKYAAQGSIILRPHKAGRRRQTEERPRQYLLRIPDSLVASQILSIFKTLKKSSLQKWRWGLQQVLRTPLLHSKPWASSLDGSASRDGASVAPKPPSSPGHGVLKGVNLDFTHIFGNNTVATVYPFEHCSFWSFVLEHEKKWQRVQMSTRLPVENKIKFLKSPLPRSQGWHNCMCKKKAVNL